MIRSCCVPGSPAAQRSTSTITACIAAGHTAQRPLGDCDGSLSLSLYAAVEVCGFGDHPCQQVNMGREWGSHARLRPAACVLAPRRRATACLISFSVEQVERSIRATAKPSINPRRIADRSMCFFCCARILIDAVVNQPLCFAESRKVVVKNSRCNRPLGTKSLSPNIRLLGYPSLHTRDDLLLYDFIGLSIRPGNVRIQVEIGQPSDIHVFLGHDDRHALQ